MAILIPPQSGPQQSHSHTGKRDSLAADNKPQSTPSTKSTTWGHTEADQYLSAIQDKFRNESGPARVLGHPYAVYYGYPYSAYYHGPHYYLYPPFHCICYDFHCIIGPHFLKAPDALRENVSTRDRLLNDVEAVALSTMEVLAPAIEGLAESSAEATSRWRGRWGDEEMKLRYTRPFAARSRFYPGDKWPETPDSGMDWSQYYSM